MPARKNLGGRPRREPDPGERVKLGLRVTPDLKRQLDAAAEKSGRSQSQEAEFRLERSFDHQELLPEVLKLAFGNRTAGLILMLAYAMTAAGYDQLMTQGHGLKQFNRGLHWIDDLSACNAAVDTATYLLRDAMPNGLPNKASYLNAIEFSHAMKVALRGDSSDPLFKDEAEMIRSLLGPIVDRIVRRKEYARVDSIVESEGVKASNVEEPAKTQVVATSAHNPFRLAINVCRAAQGLEDFSRINHPGSSILPAEPVAEILERYLKNFLLPDWQQKRGDEDKYYWSYGRAPQDVLAAELMRRRA